MANKLTIGIDLGGTNIKGILLDEDNNILEEAAAETQDDPKDREGDVWKSNVKSVVDELIKKSNGKAALAGFSAPGLANKDNTCISYLPNRLLGLEDFHWGDYLGVETFVLNDAHSHLIAESQVGVGKGYKNVVLLTLGTGVGGGILINGRLYQGELGRAGHLGHLSVNQKEDTSIVGSPGSLEDSIGECTIEQRTYGKFRSTEALVNAFRAGDTFATWVWLKSVEHLARGMVSLINAFSPQLFILAGGITQAGDALLRPLKDLLDVYEWRPGGYATELKVAATGTNTGALGAAIFARIRKSES